MVKFVTIRYSVGGGSDYGGQEIDLNFSGEISRDMNIRGEITMFWDGIVMNNESSPFRTDSVLGELRGGGYITEVTTSNGTGLYGRRKKRPFPTHLAGVPVRSESQGSSLQAMDSGRKPPVMAQNGYTPALPYRMVPLLVGPQEEAPDLADIERIRV